MQQSNVIAGFIFVAFLIYITMKGELPTYMGFLLSSAPSAYAPPTASVAPVGATASAPASGGAAKAGGGALGGGAFSQLGNVFEDKSGGAALTTVGNAAMLMFGLPPVAGAAASALTGG